MAMTNFMDTMSSRPANIVSPGFTGPTPLGVPVRMTSPGSKVKYWLMYEISDGMLKIMSFVLPCCLSTSFT